jgi:hypothetical protein
VLATMTWFLDINVPLSKKCMRHGKGKASRAR